MKVLMILGIAIFGAIGLFTGGCSLFFLIDTNGTGGGYLEVQMMGLGIAAVCALVVLVIIKFYPRSDPREEEQ